MYSLSFYVYCMLCVYYIYNRHYMGVPFFLSWAFLSVLSTQMVTVFYTASHGIPATGTPSDGSLLDKSLEQRTLRVSLNGVFMGNNKNIYHW